MMPRDFSAFSGVDRSKQRGVVLFVSLIVLVIMSLVAVAMVRQMTGGQIIAGNLAFKQNATAVADRSTEVARSFVSGATAKVLDSDLEASAYYASAPDIANPATPFVPEVYFNTAPPAFLSISGVDNTRTIDYVIHRLCPADGVFDDKVCVGRETSEGGEMGGTSYGGGSVTKQLTPYYRITTRVTGPRNSVSYTQVIIY